MNIKKSDTVVTAYAESADGPGWSNRPLWIIVRGQSGKLRQECLQPDEQTRDMWVLYNVSNVAHNAMMREVDAWRYGEKKISEYREEAREK